MYISEVHNFWQLSVKFKYSPCYTNQTNSSKIKISNLKTHLKVICDIP